MLHISSLHLLSVLLVIHRIDSMNINEPLTDVDSHASAFNFLAHEQFVPSSLRVSHDDYNLPSNHSINPIINTDKSATTWLQSNQSIDDTRNSINHAIATHQTASTSHADSLTADNQPILTDATKPITGKVYNKNDLRKRKIKSTSFDQLTDWKCPNIGEDSRYLECGCDMAYTLRCSGNLHGLQQIADGLRASKYPVSLLDCTLKNVTFLSDARIFENVSLHGLVISSGEIKRVHRQAFLGFKTSLQTLGLPNNALSSVPSQSLAPLTSLERLDLSNNRIKYLDASDFLMLQNLTFLELSDNNISGISARSFLTLKKLQTLKLNGNRLDSGNSLHAIGQCVNLKELDLSANLLRGPLTRELLPNSLKSLESLNLGTNLFTSIHTGAFEKFPFLTRLSLRHNQIDVLEDHAFSGLSSLQVLDLSYNGIVAVSGASLKHLSRLLVLNLTHNFLRALTSDLIRPLPSLKELRLDGNDISIVAKNAINGAKALESLSLQDNPLSCDCSLKPFAEWMATSKISTQDQLSAICATPPHLEGATLQEIPMESLNCDGNVNQNKNANVFHQLELRSRQNNLTFERKFSEGIVLKKIHLSMDYGLILTWSVTLDSQNFTCDAIFVYKETKFDEILMENMPVHCESTRLENENIVSVMLYDASQLTVGDKYRFCLVLVQKEDDQPDLVVGCSNITKLKQIENIPASDRSADRFESPVKVTNKRFEESTTQPLLNSKEDVISDISSFEKITDAMENEPHETHDHQLDNEDVHDYATVYQSEIDRVESSTLKAIPSAPPMDKAYASLLMTHFNSSLLPSLSIGILLTSLFGFIWAATKITHYRRSVPSTVCYAAADQHSIDIENSNRYLKLQATTTL